MKENNLLGETDVMYPSGLYILKVDIAAKVRPYPSVVSTSWKKTLDILSHTTAHVARSLLKMRLQQASGELSLAERLETGGNSIPLHLQSLFV